MENPMINSAEEEIAECKAKLIEQLGLAKSDMPKDIDSLPVKIPPIKCQGTTSCRRPRKLSERERAMFIFRMKNEKKRSNVKWWRRFDKK